ncbi:hypothetical protein PCASD_06070 [Puccinia coronata f. sp. avenae]|uniref:CxC1-like cysteine cluster associated with KDZ transposases domain-containing protein n=1 Tax=Puccinia coronata f. sp. avenae TaxID=200324 RepID=A0A2N5UZL6_9BASI|nr:hypothetical protein PCASD_06070 [Puccinia coronata f. sp. avenae]
MLWRCPWDHCVLGTALCHKTSGVLGTLWRKCIVGTLLVKHCQDAFVKKGVASLNHCPKCTNGGSLECSHHLDGFVLPFMYPLATSTHQGPVALLESVAMHPGPWGQDPGLTPTLNHVFRDLRTKAKLFSSLKLPTQSVSSTLPRVSGRRSSELLQGLSKAFPRLWPFKCGWAQGQPQTIHIAH